MRLLAITLWKLTLGVLAGLAVMCGVAYFVLWIVDAV